METEISYVKVLNLTVLIQLNLSGNVNTYTYSFKDFAWDNALLQAWNCVAGMNVKNMYRILIGPSCVCVLSIETAGRMELICCLFSLSRSLLHGFLSHIMYFFLIIFPFIVLYYSILFITYILAYNSIYKFLLYLHFWKNMNRRHYFERSITR